MARWSRDLKNCEDALGYWRNLKVGELWLFQVGDTRYEIRVVDNPPNKYVIDSFSVNDRDRKVRYVLGADLERLECRYILPEHKLEPKCPKCEGQEIVFCYSRKSDVCSDCGFEE